MAGEGQTTVTRPEDKEDYNKLGEQVEKQPANTPEVGSTANDTNILAVNINATELPVVAETRSEHADKKGRSHSIPSECELQKRLQPIRKDFKSVITFAILNEFYLIRKSVILFIPCLFATSIVGLTKSQVEFHVLGWSAYGWFWEVKDCEDEVSGVTWAETFKGVDIVSGIFLGYCWVQLYGFILQAAMLRRRIVWSTFLLGVLCWFIATPIHGMLTDWTFGLATPLLYILISIIASLPRVFRKGKAGSCTIIMKRIAGLMMHSIFQFMFGMIAPVCVGFADDISNHFVLVLLMGMVLPTLQIVLRQALLLMDLHIFNASKGGRDSEQFIGMSYLGLELLISNGPQVTLLTLGNGSSFALSLCIASGIKILSLLAFLQLRTSTKVVETEMKIKSKVKVYSEASFRGRKSIDVGSEGKAQVLHGINRYVNTTKRILAIKISHEEIGEFTSLLLAIILASPLAIDWIVHVKRAALAVLVEIVSDLIKTSICLRNNVHIDRIDSRLTKAKVLATSAASVLIMLLLLLGPSLYCASLQ